MTIFCKTVVTLGIGVSVAAVGTADAQNALRDGAKRELAAQTQSWHDALSFAMDMNPGDYVRIPIAKSADILAPAHGGGCTFYGKPDGGGMSVKTPATKVARKMPDQTVFAEVVPNVPGPLKQNISSVRCDDSPQVHCAAALYSEPNRGGDRILVWGAQGMVNLLPIRFDNKPASVAIFCTALK